MYINIADRYVHPRQVPYVREAFQAIIREVVDAEDLDLEADPTVVRQSRLILFGLKVC
jgi:Ras GTPase-activating-like protein IQGAP2/3